MQKSKITTTETPEEEKEKRWFRKHQQKKVKTLEKDVRLLREEQDNSAMEVDHQQIDQQQEQPQAVDWSDNVDELEKKGRSKKKR